MNRGLSRPLSPPARTPIMSRTLALLALATLFVGCTRYSTRGNGPFARRAKPDPNPAASIPPGPLPNTSPLTLATERQPEPPRPPDEQRVVPARAQALPDPVALGTTFTPPVREPGAVPAGGFLPDSLIPLAPRRPEPQPDALPTPFAPKPEANPVPVVPPASRAPEPAQTATARHLAEVKKLAQGAAEKWAKVETYEAVVTRRELAPNKEFSEDVVLYQFRKEPMAVFIKNLGELGKGREILYHPAKHGDKIYAVIGEGDSRLLRGGTRAPAVSPDSAIVKEKTRYSIREAGYGTPIARVLNWVAKVEAGKIPADSLISLGSVNRKEFPYPLAGVRLTLRPGDDPLMPHGGTRQWFYDTKPDSASNGYPVLIIATEPSGKEVEYYLFEKLRFGIPFTDTDFSPDRLTKKK